MDNPNKNTSIRYSDADLAEFKIIIEKKLASVLENTTQLEEQVLELNESLQASGNDLGDNSGYTNVEFLNGMILRQKKHMRDLENALLRIKNKSYGLCTLTGHLIEKKRLHAVPTTTKSLQAKTEAQRQEETKSNPKPDRRRPMLSDRPKKFTKVIKKPSKNKPSASDLTEDDDLDFELVDDNYEESNMDSLDLDSLVDEDTLDD